MASNLRTAAVTGLIIGVAAFVIAVGSGLLYEQAQRVRDREFFPQIGRSTDIGGRMLNIYNPSTPSPGLEPAGSVHLARRAEGPSSFVFQAWRNLSIRCRLLLL